MKANKQVNKIQRKCKTPRLQLDAYQDLVDDKKGKKVINLFLYCVPLRTTGPVSKFSLYTSSTDCSHR